MTPGTPYEGGFYVGRYQLDGENYALILAPKAAGEIAGDLNSAIEWASALEIAGHADWHLPSLDELELCYRALKPGTEKNSPWGRSGINLSAVPPTWPYTPDLPTQTTVDAFQANGPEAFTPEWYWSSTQPAAGYAGCQFFGNGFQGDDLEAALLRARAVRRVRIV